MSFEDRKSACEEALDAIEAAGLGNELDAARSFVLARYGSALILNGATLEAAEKFKESCRCNALKRPDRPYNLACSYARLSATAGTPAERTRYEALALDELEKCFEFATDGPLESTFSKAYYRQECTTDSDLNSIRKPGRFVAITT
jgi:hypothetical protein